MKRGQEWSHEQIEYLTIHYPNERAVDIAVVIGKKDDNRIENLVVLTHGAHTTLHNMGGKL